MCPQGMDRSSTGCLLIIMSNKKEHASSLSLPMETVRATVFSIITALEDRRQQHHIIRFLHIPTKTCVHTECQRYFKILEEP